MHSAFNWAPSKWDKYGNISGSLKSKGSWHSDNSLLARSSKGRKSTKAGYLIYLDQTEPTARKDSSTFSMTKTNIPQYYTYVLMIRNIYVWPSARAVWLISYWRNPWTNTHCLHFAFEQSHFDPLSLSYKQPHIQQQCDFLGVMHLVFHERDMWRCGGLKCERSLTPATVPFSFHPII